MKTTFVNQQVGYWFSFVFLNSLSVTDEMCALTSTRWLSGPYRSLSSSMTRLLKKEENFLLVLLESDDLGFCNRREQGHRTRNINQARNLSLYRACLFSKSSLARLQEFWNSSICLYEIKRKNLFKSTCPTGRLPRAVGQWETASPAVTHGQCYMIQQGNW